MSARKSTGKEREGWIARLVDGATSETTLTWLRGGLLLGLLGLLLWGSLEVRSRIRRDDRFFLDQWALEAGALPAWVTPEIRGELEGMRFAEGADRYSLFEPSVLDKVRAGLEQSPWIHKVKDIRIHYPTQTARGILELELILERPVALVEHEGLFYLTDARSRRLGFPYREAPIAWFQVPVIRGFTLAGGVPAAGEPWSSRDVQQGVEVAKILFENAIWQEFPDRPVEAIDLSNLHGRLRGHDGEVYLVCGHQRLSWGRSPISSRPRSAPVAEVVANLRFVLGHPEIYASYPEIELHHGSEGVTGRGG